MANSNKLIVQKYGGATLSSPEKIKQVAKRVFNLYQSGTKVVVVVSAMGDTTNQLITLANQVSERPHLRELDMLLTAGERISMSLLSMALNDLGCPAISFTGSQAGILTDDAHISANILEIKAFRVEEALKENKIVILAGFQGVSLKTKEITTLGRGGSDISAVAMASYLKADRCEILKDVDCIFTADPKLIKTAIPIQNLNYDHLLEMTTWGAKVLNSRSVQLAKEKMVPLYVGPSDNSESHGTLIKNDFRFDSKKILAINSHSRVFLIQCSSFEIFQNYINNNQIGQTFLLKDMGDHFYVTAPKETLDLIAKFSTQNIFVIKRADLCSVSITFAERTLNQDLEKIQVSEVDIIDKLTTTYGLHFFVHEKQRDQAVKILHKYTE